MEQKELLCNALATVWSASTRSCSEHSIWWWALWQCVECTCTKVTYSTSILSTVVLQTTPMLTIPNIVAVMFSRERERDYLTLWFWTPVVCGGRVLRHLRWEGRWGSGRLVVGAGRTQRCLTGLGEEGWEENHITANDQKRWFLVENKKKSIPNGNQDPVWAKWTNPPHFTRTHTYSKQHSHTLADNTLHQ